MAYPWQSAPDRWLLGLAVAAVVILFAWWRGFFLTTMLSRRIALLARRGKIGVPATSDEYATVALRVEPRESAELPLGVVASYLDRYGISFDKVRVTSRDIGGSRTTWVTLTLGAAENLSALSARSSHIPLQDTAQLAARRLSDHLREIGWEVTLDETPAVPVAEPSKETWRGVSDAQGYLAAYRIAADEQLADNLSAVWSSGADEVWTAVEFTGSRRRPEVAAACALRTGGRPGRVAPVSGLTPEAGLHAPALTALAPDSDQRLSAHATPAGHGLLATLRWPAGAALSRT
jgi:type VII secretion protein EccE